MSLGNRSTDREAEPHAVALGGSKCLEKIAGDLVRQSRTAVGDGDLNHLVVKQRGAHVQLMPLAACHCLMCIAQQINQQLLHLDTVYQHPFGLGIKTEFYLRTTLKHGPAEILERFKRKRSDFGKLIGDE